MAADGRRGGLRRTAPRDFGAQVAGERQQALAGGSGDLATGHSCPQGAGGPGFLLVASDFSTSATSLPAGRLAMTAGTGWERSVGFRAGQSDHLLLGQRKTGDCSVPRFLICVAPEEAQRPCLCAWPAASWSVSPSRPGGRARPSQALRTPLAAFVIKPGRSLQAQGQGLAV